MVELIVIGISLQEEAGSPVLLLHPQGTQRILSVRIGPVEAFAISMALHGEDGAGGIAGTETGNRQGASEAPPDSRSAPARFPRPLTHDLLLNVISALGGKLVAVELTGLEQGAFLAEAVLERGGEVRVDCRPSDGIALALRCGAAIRASETVVSHAESIELVMAGLPEHVRALAAAKLVLLPGGDNLIDRMRMPAIVRTALETQSALSGDRFEELISVARKMLEEEEAAARQAGHAAKAGAEQSGPSPRPAADPPARKPDADTPPVPPKKIMVRPQVIYIGPDGKKAEEPPDGLPQIRVTMVRRKNRHETEILNEFHVPASGIPRDVLVSLGLSPREADAVNGASDEERWATLLRLLSPETKVPM